MSRLLETAGGHSGPSELPVGMKLEVLTPDACLIFMGKLQWAKNGVYQFTEENGEPVPYIEYNSRVKLRGHANGQPVFVDGVIVGSTNTMWRVEQRQTIRGAEQRAFFRQNVRMEIMLTCGNALLGGECGEKTPEGKFFTGTLQNLSAGGVQISTPADFKQTDWIHIVEVELMPGEPPFSFMCAIRRKVNVDNKGREFVYGCQFQEMSPVEQDRLIKAILYLQRKELRARRGGGRGI